MLTQTEFNATLQVGTSSLDGTPTYNYNKVTRRQMYKDYVRKQEMNTSEYNCVGAFTGRYSLAPMPTAVPCSVPTPKYGYGGEVCNNEKGNNPMNYASASISTPATETQDQRKYLERRLYDVYQTKKSPLQAQFGLIDDDAPETLADLKARIEGGKFTFKDEKDIRVYHHWTEMLKWRDPAKKADQAGYDAAKADLKAQYQTAQDTIKIDEPKAGLDAVKALEAWEPTGAAN